MRVVIAPDSFKGTINAADAAHALASGWRQRRPDDDISELPLADGGEGTLSAFSTAETDARVFVATVRGPDGSAVNARWLLSRTGVAVVELAESSGISLMKRLDPMGAHTFGLGETIAEAVRSGCSKVVIALGGSASTDGGTGALRALGARFLDSRGAEISLGGAGVRMVHDVDTSNLLAPPRGGVSLLTDVTAPLVGRDGAAARFGPQKGATPAQVEILDSALRRLSDVVGGNPDEPGAGAAGGTGFGFATLWGGRITPGAATVAALTGLADELANADIVVTGEGRFDATSLSGKVVGHVVDQAAGKIPVYVVAGVVDQTALAAIHDETAHPTRIDAAISLSDLAGSAKEAISSPARWLAVAANQLAANQSAAHPR